MKSTLSISGLFIVLIMMTFTACETDNGNDTDPLLCYKWIIDKYEVYLNGNLVDEVDMSTSLSYLEFDNDGTFESNMIYEDASTTEGTYTYKDQTLTLAYLRQNGDKENDTTSVLLLTATNLQIMVSGYHFEDDLGIEQIGQMKLFAHH